MKESLLKRSVTIILLFVITFVLVTGLQLKHKEKADSPLKEFYIENHKQTGSVNLVESILLDYRAYDTFGEVMVLYIAISGVMILGKKIYLESDSNFKRRDSS